MTKIDNLKEFEWTCAICSYFALGVCFGSGSLVPGLFTIPFAILTFIAYFYRKRNLE